MGLPFIITEGVALIADTLGNIIESVSTGAKRRLAVDTTVTGSDGLHRADVQLIEGAPSLRTFGIQAIESLRGFDPISDVWFYIGTELDSKGVGDAGDIVTVTILAGDDPIIFPAVTVNTTVVVNDTETTLGNQIVLNLNADPNFNINYFARRLDLDAVTVYISSKLPGPRGERPNGNDFDTTATGTTVVTRAFDRIIRRNKVTSLARDPANPTLGILGISGSVTAGEGDVTGRIIEFAKDSGGAGSEDLLVNGSNTPVDFFINASTLKERFFTSLRFEALGNGIQFTKFLSKNTDITNGISVTIRSNDSEITFPSIHTTEDFASIFSRGPSDFDVYDVSGTDYFRATLNFTAPFQLFKVGTFPTDDFIKVTVQDNISSGIVQFRFIGFGFEREF